MDQNIFNRVQLKRSIETESSLFHDPIDKRSKSLDQFVQDPFYLLMHKDIIGKGEYGYVKDLKTPDGESSGVVAKITGCISYLIGDPNSALFRSEHLEPRILNLLWKYLVETHISPHIICPIGAHSIIDGVLPEQKERDPDMTHSLVFFMEKCNSGNLRNYLKNTGGNNFDHILKVLLFQVCYTLGVIFTKWPNFRHNDLKDDNIFIHRTGGSPEDYPNRVPSGVPEGAPRGPAPERGRVYRIYDKCYRLPDIGVIALIGDFDFACISGYMFDNYKVLEQEWNTPSLNINSREDHRADLYSLVTYLRASFGGGDGGYMSKNLKREFDLLFGKYRDLNNYHRLFPGNTKPPTVESLFKETGFFDEFLLAPRVPEDPNGRPNGYPGGYPGEDPCGIDFDENRIIPLRVTYERSPPVPDGISVRWVPIILPRKAQEIGETLLPSLIYFRSCPPASPEVDSDIGVVYNKRLATKMINYMSFVYSCSNTEEIIQAYNVDTTRFEELIENFDSDLCQFYAFSEGKEKKTQFLSQLGKRAEAFLVKYIVPLKYWYLVYSCAFVDELYFSNVCEGSQLCWTHNNWGDFWEITKTQKFTSLEIIQFVLQWNWLRE